MTRAALVALMVALTGCASNTPPPVVLPTPVLCRVPAGLLRIEPAPDAPRGAYTQKHVALYVVALHQWGQAQQQQLKTIKDWNQHCE